MLKTEQWRQAERVGVFQPGKGRALEKQQSSLPVPKGACKTAGEGLLARAWRDRTRGDDFTVTKVDLE